MSTGEPNIEPAESGSHAPVASVVVVTHNNESLIGRCLASVTSAAREHDCEVIVVDNASSDQTRRVAAGAGGSARVIALDENIGFAGAANLGIRNGRGEFVVLVNSDAFPDEGSIDGLIRAMRERPRAGIIGGRLRYPDGGPQPSAGSFPSLLGNLWVALLLHRAPLTGRAGVGLLAHPALYRRPRTVDWVSAALCIARREAGPLPEDTFMYGEDVLWARRCEQRGLSVWIEPAATAVHIGRASVEHSQARGFAQRRRVEFELQWFSHRTLAARAVLAIHALVRIGALMLLAVFGRGGERRLAEQTALLRAAVRLREHSRSEAEVAG